MTTVADAGNIPRTEHMDGISILPTLTGQPEQQAGRDYLYWEFYEKAPQQAVRKGKWKAYRLNGVTSPIELYNLEADPYEQSDLAAQYPEIIAEMAQIMEKEHHITSRYDMNKCGPLSAGALKKMALDLAK
jgi:arylsulfatase A-like enzyme